MLVTLETPQIVFLALAFLGMLSGFGKLLLNQIDRRLEKRFDTIEKQGAEWQRLERDFLTFKAELPVHYVRREDYVRGQSTIEAKLDAIAAKTELVQLTVARTRRGADPGAERGESR